MESAPKGVNQKFRLSLLRSLSTRVLTLSGKGYSVLIEMSSATPL
ncbi:MAG: Uncharacterised protein [SAR116 cluster bacterium]|nr:MAG: Uncharacterised protein [SAR116 cluster bacterium]